MPTSSGYLGIWDFIGAWGLGFGALSGLCQFRQTDWKPGFAPLARSYTRSARPTPRRVFPGNALAQDGGTPQSAAPGRARSSIPSLLLRRRARRFRGRGRDWKRPLPRPVRRSLDEPGRIVLRRLLPPRYPALVRSQPG